MQIIMQKLIEKMKAVSYQLSVVSIQYSVFSCQLFSIQLSAISATRRVHGGRSLIAKLDASNQ